MHIKARISLSVVIKVSSNTQTDVFTPDMYAQNAHIFRSDRR